MNVPIASTRFVWSRLAAKHTARRPSGRALPPVPARAVALLVVLALAASRASGAPFFVGLEGWQLTDAFALSDDGTAIAGAGLHDGVSEAWYAIIPEPQTALLLGLGLAGLAVRRRHRCRAGDP